MSVESADIALTARASVGGPCYHVINRGNARAFSKGECPLFIPIRAGVSLLIAGISWLDALLMALAGGTWLAAIAVGGALLTRLAHRMIPGT